MTTTDIKRDALERAETLHRGIEGGPGYWGRLYAHTAAAILEAKAEEADRLGDHFRAIEYRHAAAEIREGGE
jgi:hypothetical protein